MSDDEARGAESGVSEVSVGGVPYPKEIFAPTQPDEAQQGGDEGAGDGGAADESGDSGDGATEEDAQPGEGQSSENDGE